MVKETNVDVKEKTLEAVEAASGETTEAENIELYLKPSEAEIIKDLLSNYVYAYRSDDEVDCKREPVEKDKVGIYPYPPTDPTPGLIKPAYDWVNNTWYDKSKEGLSQLYQRIDNFDKEKENLAKAIEDVKETQSSATAQSLAMTKMLKNVTENQATTNKVLASMQKILVAIQQPAADKEEIGGN